MRRGPLVPSTLSSYEMDATGKLPGGGFGDTCLDPLPEEVRPTALMDGQLAGGWLSKMVNLVPRKLDLEEGALRFKPGSKGNIFCFKNEVFGLDQNKGERFRPRSSEVKLVPRKLDLGQEKENKIVRGKIINCKGRRRRLTKAFARWRAYCS